jgi:outer membrane protein assembly factor BamB
MTTDAVVAMNPIPQATPEQKPRIWLPIALVVIYWAYVVITNSMEMPMFPRFLSQTGVLIVVGLVFLIWWLFNRRVKLADKFIVLGAAIASLIVAKVLSDQTLGPFPIMSGLPLVFTGWALWMLLARKARAGVWKGGLIVALFLSTAIFPMLRMEGLGGGGMPEFRWRWSHAAEDEYLARRAPSTLPAQTQAVALTLRTGDWPGFRGANRDGVVRGLTINTAWDKSPPRQVWRHPIGPGWSSMTIVDGRLFTQEQRGEHDVVVCMDAASGGEIWSHAESGRFWDPLSSAGPRATPTFDRGRIYAQGATGTLLCLDAASGQKIWSRDILVDANAKMPDWGVSSSPLVSHGVVVVYATGHGGKGLMGYRCENGELAWTVNAGMYSYSSAHAANIGGQEQVLFISDKGMVSVEPAGGKVLWEYAAPGQPPRSLQPLMMGDGKILVHNGLETATDLIEVARNGDGYAATKVWSTKNLKPSFNDYVLHNRYVYGFDNTVFSCVDAKTGERKWRKGHYGTGQALLLADQSVLLVLSDRGKVVLVAAKPESFEELGQFSAIEGKTWNHPAIAQGRLYVRNSQEIACYELK